MNRSRLVIVLVLLLIGGLVPAAAAADLDTSWGTGGVASFPMPTDTDVTDTALLTDGRVVAVGHSGGFSSTPWGTIISADGTALTPLSGFVSPDTTLRAVATGNDRIYAVGEVSTGLSTIVAVFDSAGVFLGSDTISTTEVTIPTSAAVDGQGRLFVAGLGNLGSPFIDHGFVARFTAAGTRDPAFPILELRPPDVGSTNPVAYVGVTDGQAVAVVTGDDDPMPGSSIGFHRIAESGSVFMADFSSARTIVSTDIDSSSGRTVFGTLTPGASLTDSNYLIHAIDNTGVPAVTSSDNWIDVAGRLEVGRVRTGPLLGAGEGDVNTFVQLVQTGASFASRSDSELIDVATSPVDGAVYVSSMDVPSGDLVVAKYQGDSSGRFIDDDTSVHEVDIERLDALGITRGCNPPVNDLYCPTDYVTRGQMAAFLNRAVSLPVATVDFFVDDAGSVFEDDINAIAAAGITLGCNPPTNDNYCPNDNVTRAQMASFIVRAVDG